MKKPVVLGLVIAARIAGDCRWNGGGIRVGNRSGLTLYGNVDIRSAKLSFRVGAGWPLPC